MSIHKPTLHFSAIYKVKPKDQKAAEAALREEGKNVFVMDEVDNRVYTDEHVAPAQAAEADMESTAFSKKKTKQATRDFMKQKHTHTWTA